MKCSKIIKPYENPMSKNDFAQIFVTSYTAAVLSTVIDCDLSTNDQTIVNPRRDSRKLVSGFQYFFFLGELGTDEGTYSPNENQKSSFKLIRRDANTNFQIILIR